MSGALLAFVADDLEEEMALNGYGLSQWVGLAGLVLSALFILALVVT